MTSLVGANEIKIQDTVANESNISIGTVSYKNLSVDLIVNETQVSGQKATWLRID